MINSLNNEADIKDKFASRPTEIDRVNSINKYDRHVDNLRLSKCTSYQPTLNLNSKTTEMEWYSLTDGHHNNNYKSTSISISGNNDANSRDSRYHNSAQLRSFYKTENDKDSSSNKSYELSHDNRFKNAFNSTPLAPSGPVRLPYIIGGGSPTRTEINGSAYHRIGAHHHSISESSTYAIGVGKTVSSSNLKATVSGGKMYVEGMRTEDARPRIEMKCSINGNVTKISPRKIAQHESDSHYNHYYHKFRQK